MKNYLERDKVIDMKTLGQTYSQIEIREVQSKSETQ